MRGSAEFLGCKYACFQDWRVSMGKQKRPALSAEEAVITGSRPEARKEIFAVAERQRRRGV